MLGGTQLAGSRCQVEDRNNAQQRNPFSERWAGVSLAANLGIQSGPHLPADGGFLTPSLLKVTAAKLQLEVEF